MPLPQLATACPRPGGSRAHGRAAAPPCRPRAPRPREAAEPPAGISATSPGTNGTKPTSGQVRRRGGLPAPRGCRGPGQPRNPPPPAHRPSPRRLRGAGPGLHGGTRWCRRRQVPPPRNSPFPPGLPDSRRRSALRHRQPLTRQWPQRSPQLRAAGAGPARLRCPARG